PLSHADSSHGSQGDSTTTGTLALFDVHDPPNSSPYPVNNVSAKRVQPPASPPACRLLPPRRASRPDRDATDSRTGLAVSEPELAGNRPTDDADPRFLQPRASIALGVASVQGRQANRLWHVGARWTWPSIPFAGR